MTEYTITRRDIPEQQARRAEQLPLIMTRMQKRRIPAEVRREVDWDLVHAEARVALWKAEQTWDPGRGMQFTTWAMTKVRNQVRQTVREIRRLKRPQQDRMFSAWREGRELPESYLEPFSLDRIMNDQTRWSDLLIEPGMTPDDDRRLELMMALAVLSEIHPRYRDVLERYLLHEMTLKEVGIGSGLSESRAFQLYHDALVQARERARQRGYL